MKTNKTHLIAVSQALLVTFLWSTSWVFIKIGLKSDLPAITFAGLRYTLAAFCLLPFAILNPIHRQTLRQLPARTWWELIGLGMVFYTLTQGAQFISLSFLPSATLSLLLNFSPIFIAVYGITSHSESTSLTQWGGILVTVIGVLIYFAPLPSKKARSLACLPGWSPCLQMRHHPFLGVISTPKRN